MYPCRNMCLDEYRFEIRYFIKMIRRYWLKRLSNIILYFLIKTFDILNRYHRQICNLSGSLPMQLSPAQNTDKTEMLLYFINVEKNRCFCYTQKQRKWDLIFLPKRNKYEFFFLEIWQNFNTFQGNTFNMI